MTMTYFAGDLHLGHRNICKYRTMFANQDDHRNLIHERYHSRVGKRDTVYFMGDVCFSPEALEDLSDWSGRKILVLGNHDVLESGRPDMRDLTEVFDKVGSLIRYKEFWLSHAPLHPQELRKKKNIHGHVHTNTIPDGRYLNVSCENINYLPISIEEVRRIFNKRTARGYGDYITRVGEEASSVTHLGSLL